MTHSMTHSMTRSSICVFILAQISSGVRGQTAPALTVKA